MPIRSPRGRAAAYRALWQWPLRSPARLAVTAAVVVSLGVGASVVLGAVGGGRASVIGSAHTSAGARPTPGAPSPPSPTALPPVPELRPSTLPLSRAPGAALQVAQRWTQAWLRPKPSVTARQWLDGLRPYTDEEYLGVLEGVDPANIPSTRVTGDPKPVEVRERSVEVEVPTDALTLRLLVVDTADGWRVAGYQRA